MLGLLRKLRRSDAASPPTTPPAPTQLTLAGQSYWLADFYTTQQGLSLQNSPVILNWLSHLADDLRLNAQTELQQAWLLQLAKQLGSAYRLDINDNLMLLSPLPDDKIKAAQNLLLRPQKRINSLLQGLLNQATKPPIMLLVFEDEPTYLSYLQQTGSEQAYRVNSACPHFVGHRESLFQMEGWFGNYLLHQALLELGLPRWLHEGIAANVQQKINSCQSSCRCGPPALHQQHVAYWTTSRIQAFWGGTLFDEPESAGVLAYDLARILVAAMAENWAQFIVFARHCQPQDAGNQAAHNYLEIELGRLACAALEQDYDEAWSPQSPVFAH